MKTAYTRTAGIIALAIALTACSAGHAPHSTLTTSAPPSPTGSISVLPTPSDYMTVLCLRFETAWLGWRPQQKVTPDMKLTVKDLARPGSTYRKQAQDLTNAIAADEADLDPRLRQPVDNVLGLEYMYLASACDELL